MSFWNFMRDMMAFDWLFGDRHKNTNNSSWDDGHYASNDCYHDSHDDYAHDFDDFDDDF